MSKDIYDELKRLERKICRCSNSLKSSEISVDTTASRNTFYTIDRSSNNVTVILDSSEGTWEPGDEIMIYVPYDAGASFDLVLNTPDVWAMPPATSITDSEQKVYVIRYLGNSIWWVENYQFENNAPA